MMDPTRIKPAADAVMRALMRAGIGDDLPACISALAACAGGLALASGVPEAVLRDFGAEMRMVIEKLDQ